MKLWEKGAFLSGGKLAESVPGKNPVECAKNTIAYSILQKHNTSGDASKLKIKFDKIIRH